MEAKRKERGSSEHSSTRKSEATRARIIDAARKLIREGDGTDFQMKDVAALCKMSKGSVYYYFSDRNDLVMEVFNISVSTFTERLETVIADAPNAHEGLVLACKEFSQEMRDGGLVFLTMASELVQDRGGALATIEDKLSRITDLVKNAIDGAKAEGFVREDVVSDIAATSICGTFFFAALSEWSGGTPAVSDDDRFRDTVSMLIRGFGTEKADVKLAENGY